MAKKAQGTEIPALGVSKNLITVPELDQTYVL